MIFIGIALFAGQIYTTIKANEKSPNLFNLLTSFIESNESTQRTWIVSFVTSISNQALIYGLATEPNDGYTRDKTCHDNSTYFMGLQLHHSATIRLCALRCIIMCLFVCSHTVNSKTIKRNERKTMSFFH